MTLRVALGEYDTGWQDPRGSLTRAARLVALAAQEGAGLVVLPEMCTTGFTMDAHAWAEPIDGASMNELARMAKTTGTAILAGVAVREEHSGSPCAFNTAVLLQPDGGRGPLYRKQRLFRYGGEHESYTPGSDAVIMEVGGVRLSPFVCYDLRFPELFRAVAPRVELIVVIANWPAARRAHWDVLARARAIENQCYLVAVNRTGVGGTLAYDGGSVAYDPWGEPLPIVGDGGHAPPCVDIDPTRVAEIRGRYPFLVDMA